MQTPKLQQSDKMDIREIQLTHNQTQDQKRSKNRKNSWSKSKKIFCRKFVQ